MRDFNNYRRDVVASYLLLIKIYFQEYIYHSYTLFNLNSETLALLTVIITWNLLEFWNFVFPAENSLSKYTKEDEWFCRKCILIIFPVFFDLYFKLKLYSKNIEEAHSKRHMWQKNKIITKTHIYICISY